MIDYNQSEFAGSTPTSETAANWNWLKDRLHANSLDVFHEWMEEQLVALEENYADFMSPKSLQQALRNELRDSRSE